ncbi:uncharacterized protein LOC118429639 [Branchiostoma floridae]|uniref:Uncharacterized protein LOC118429639 n=1 Tax=Branchiostoma floridae TaxID=7739 RepID=A0A9J7N9G9_BRAFL|nr:uncharacterized protein LOC118429639 [Branchiostoma floridae]
MKAKVLKKYVPYKNKRRWYIASNCYLGWAGDKAMKLQPVKCKFVRRENYKTIVKVVNPSNVKSHTNTDATEQQEGMPDSTIPTIIYGDHEKQDKINGYLELQCSAKDASQVQILSHWQERVRPPRVDVIEGTTEWGSTTLRDDDIFKVLNDIDTQLDDFSVEETEEEDRDQDRMRTAVEALLAEL